MRVFKLFGGLTFVVFNFLLIMGLVSAMSDPTMFDVNSMNDATDANPGDGICETAAGNGTCTLRAAIQESNALAGEDTIMLPGGTYILTIAGVLEDGGAFGDLDITDNLILTGDGAENTIIDGNALDRVLHIANENAVVQMSGLTIRNGHIPFNRGGGGGVYNEGTLQLSHSKITNNTVNTDGGGLLNVGSLTLNHNTITDNKARDGGGVYNLGSVQLSHNTITENNARSGGGVFNAGTVELSHNSITHNTADYGAGFYNGNSNSSSNAMATVAPTMSASPTAGVIDRAAISNSSGATSPPTAPPTRTPQATSTVWRTPTNTPTAVSNPVSAMIENSIISENIGDGIYNRSTMTLSESTVSHNNGDGISNFSTMTLSDSTISNNNGNGIYNLHTLTLNNSTVSDNSRNGLINESNYRCYYDVCTATLNNSRISNNSDSGLFNNGQLTLNNSTVSGNSAFWGGGIYNQGVLTLNNSMVTANSAINDGGGIISFNDDPYNDDATLMLNNSIVSGNSTNGNGGGIYSTGRFTLQNSTINDNYANEHGGGIYSNANQPLTLNNSTISGNQSNRSGGAIYNGRQESTLNLSSVTITNNTADSDGNESGDGGGLFNLIGLVNMQNTIMAANHDHSPTTQHTDCSSVSVLNSLGYNLIIQDLACPVGGDTTGNLIDLDPNLGPLQDNGGPTLTHALLADSPALDAGNPAGCADENGTLLSYDQIGVPRTLDGNADGSARCDIGAYELSLTPITPLPFTPVPSAPVTSTPIPTITTTPAGTPSPTHTPTATPTPQSVSVRITSQGGSLTHTYAGHRTTLEVPPNAVSAPSQFRISYHTPPAMSGRLIGMDHFFDVEASQNTFNLPLTLTIRYSETVRGPMMAGTEQLYGWQEGQWVTDGMTLTDRLSNQLTIQVDHLSVFGVLGETNPLYLPLILEGSTPGATPTPTQSPTPIPTPTRTPTLPPIPGYLAPNQ